MDQNTVAKFKNVWNEQNEQASVTEPSQPVAVSHFNPGSQYFACVALRPEVDVNACCNTRIRNSIPALCCVAACVQINLYALLVAMQLKQNIVNQALYLSHSAFYSLCCGHTLFCSSWVIEQLEAVPCLLPRSAILCLSTSYLNWFYIS